MRRVLLIGATSAIVEAVGRHFAGDGDSIYLLGRSPQRTEQVANDYRLRGADSVYVETFDALDYEQHAPLIKRAIDTLGGLDVALIGYGTLPDQAAAEASFDVARLALEVNAISVISLLGHLANRFEQQESGALAVISSVAGDRGRRSNYVYGTAKGAVSLYAEGLRARLADKHVSVLTIKPGFVDTPMTAAFDKGPLWSTPEKVALSIYKAILRGSNEIYTPWFWRWIMAVIRAIPESIFKRLPL
jgi:decaprenylphospho-beta-D-erythro-pentofuranosid-2-ulose 2-reductase